MRALTGAVLILAAEQSFAHALTIGFPYATLAQYVLIPFSATSLLIGFIFLAYGIKSDKKSI